MKIKTATHSVALYMVLWKLNIEKSNMIRINGAKQLSDVSYFSIWIHTCVWFACVFMSIGNHVAQNNVNLSCVSFIGYRSSTRALYNREYLQWFTNAMVKCGIRKQRNCNYKVTAIYTCYFDNQDTRIVFWITKCYYPQFKKWDWTGSMLSVVNIWFMKMNHEQAVQWPFESNYTMPFVSGYCSL